MFSSKVDLQIIILQHMVTYVLYFTSNYADRDGIEQVSNLAFPNRLSARRRNLLL